MVISGTDFGAAAVTLRQTTSKGWLRAWLIEAGLSVAIATVGNWCAA